jgi:hypothetical protein
MKFLTLRTPYFVQHLWEFTQESRKDENPSRALGYIKNEVPHYWDKRDMIKQLLSFIKDTKDIDNLIPHWELKITVATEPRVRPVRATPTES